MMPFIAPGEAYPVTDTGNERSIGRFEFSPDRKSIAFLSADEKPAKKKAKEKEKDDAKVWGEDWPFNRLRLVHLATKKVTTLAGQDAHVADLAWNNNGTKIAITETKTPEVDSAVQYGTTISVVDVTNRDITIISVFLHRVSDLTWTGEMLYFSGAVVPNETVSDNSIWSVDSEATTSMYEHRAHGIEDSASGRLR